MLKKMKKNIFFFFHATTTREKLDNALLVTNTVPIPSIFIFFSTSAKNVCLKVRISLVDWDSFFANAVKINKISIAKQQTDE